MPQRTIIVSGRIDLGKLLYPSFILPLIEVDVKSNVLFKKWGYCRNLKIKREDSSITVIHEQEACLWYADEILGLWFDIDRCRRGVSRGYQELIDRLVEMHGELGIATSPSDDIEIFSSIFLSRATDFHRNTVKWLKTILSEYDGLDRITYMDGYVSKRIGGSFQIKQWIEVLGDYLKIRSVIKGVASVDEVKSALLRIKFVGPKVVYAYILFVLKNTSYAPVDRNFLKFLRKIAVTRTLIGMIPRKELCIEYTCDRCRYGEKCTLQRVRSAFKYMSGWLQTVAYFHTKTMCGMGLCSVCRLKDLCLDSSHQIH